MRDLGADMAMRVISEMLGIPEADQEAVRDHIDAGLRIDRDRPSNDIDAATLLFDPVAAFVVAAQPVEPAALLEHCRAELASYKVPRHLWLRREDELPLRGSGKVDKALLRAEAARLAGARLC